MVDLTLTKTQRNAVFREVVAFGIDPKGFEWGSFLADYDNQHSVLRYPLTKSYFKFWGSSASWSPSLYGRREDEDTVEAGDWNKIIEKVRGCLVVLKPEVEEPDLWEALRQDRLTSEAASSGETENRLFTVAEQKFIADQLKSIHDAIVAAHSLTQTQIRGLQTGFRYLVESSERLGRKDWINLAVGTVVNIAVAAAFAPEAGRDLLHMLTSSL